MKFGQFIQFKKGIVSLNTGHTTASFCILESIFLLSADLSESNASFVGFNPSGAGITSTTNFSWDTGGLKRGHLNVIEFAGASAAAPKTSSSTEESFRKG